MPGPDLQKLTTPARRQRSLATLVAGMLLATVVALGGAPAPASAYDEGTIVALANDARAANGLGGLVRNGALDSVALNWANQMAASGTLSHNPSVGQQIPGGWTRWGENVAQGYGSGSAVHQGWMNSSGHRANILGPFTDIGVALIQAGGTTWAVQVFAAYPGSGQPAPAPAPAQPAPAAPAPAPPAPAPVQAEPQAPEPSATADAPVDAAASPTSSPSAEIAPSPRATPSSSRTAAAASATADLGGSVVAAATLTPWWPWLVALLTLGLLAGTALPAVQRVLRRRAVRDEDTSTIENRRP